MIPVHCPYDRLVPINELNPDPDNPNNHPEAQIEQLAKILSYQGWRSIPVVEGGTNVIKSGHGRILAAITLGETEVPVSFQKFQDSDQAYAYLVSDNGISEQSKIDRAKVNVAMERLGPDFDVELLGLKSFKIDLNEDDGEAQVGDHHVQPKTRPGDLWTLGRHRLLCGNSASEKDVTRLLDGVLVEMVFTDPPFNIGLAYEGYDDNKSDEDFESVLADVFGQAFIHLKDRGHCLFTMGHKWMFKTKAIVERVGFDFRHLGIWHNPQRKAGGNPGQWPISYEAVLDFTKNGFRKLNNGNSVGHTDVWIEAPTHETGHPAQKPLGLWTYLLELCTDDGERVYDPFCGSGSTLIACEKSGRQGLGMELDPVYCDLILARFASMTSQDPVREDGVKWAEISA